MVPREHKVYVLLMVQDEGKEQHTQNLAEAQNGNTRLLLTNQDELSHDDVNRKTIIL